MELSDRIGCWPTPQGSFFRVWAPHAANVSVALQTGQSWDSNQPSAVHDLTRVGDYWHATVAGVHPGQLYRFRIITATASSSSGSTPAARDVLSSELTRNDPTSRNASIVPDAGPLPVGAVRPPARSRTS